MTATYDQPVGPGFPSPEALARKQAAATRPKAGPALQAAEDALRHELGQFDRIVELTEEQWQEREMISALLTVVDHARRIYQADSGHYRADKSGPLLRGAIEVQDVAFRRYGRDEKLDATTDVAREATSALRRVLWANARGETLEPADTCELQRIAEAFRTLARS